MTGVSRAFPPGHTGFTGRCLSSSEHQDPGTVHPCPAIVLLPHMRPHAACHSWREARADNSLAKEQTPFHGDAEQFLIHLDAPPGLGCAPAAVGDTKVSWLVPLPPLPRVCAPNDCAGTQQGMDPPQPRHTSPPPSLPGAPLLGCSAPQHCPAPSSPRLESPGLPGEQCGSSHPPGKVFGKYFLWRSAPSGNISPADGI